MKNIRKFFAGILCLSIGAFTLLSCEDDDPDPLKALVDVIIQDYKTDAGLRYGLVIYATSNYELKSVKVTGPGTSGKVYPLTAMADKRQYVFEMVTGDYTAALPPKGNYSFEVISTSDEKITVIDAVGDEKLAPITIKTASMASQKLKTTWDKITGTDAYVIKLYSANKAELLFSSSFISSDKAEYEFNALTQGWSTGKKPSVNTNYVVELIGVKVETGVITDKGNNIQFLTLDSKAIKWE